MFRSRTRAHTVRQRAHIHRAPAPQSRCTARLLPVETFHITTGIKGGIAGGIAMIVPATLFSLLKYHSLWYADEPAGGRRLRQLGRREQPVPRPVPPAGSAGRPRHSHRSPRCWSGCSTEPCCPCFPGGLSSLPASSRRSCGPAFSPPSLGIVSPILNERIDWFWFVPSQIAFGLVCGFVVNLQAKVRTPQFQALPFAVRAGLEGGMDEERRRERIQEKARQ